MLSWRVFIRLVFTKRLNYFLLNFGFQFYFYFSLLLQSFFCLYVTICVPFSFNIESFGIQPFHFNAYPVSAVQKTNKQMNLTYTRQVLLYSSNVIFMIKSPYKCQSMPDFPSLQMDIKKYKCFYQLLSKLINQKQ